MLLDGKVVIITGGTRGIGREIVLLLAGEGAYIVVNYVENDNAAKLLENQLGDKVLCIKTSVVDRDAVDQMMASVYEQFGKIDILINNAGILRVGYFAGMISKDWSDIIDINLNGCYNCTQAVLKYMQRGGCIINIASYAGLAGLFDFGHAVYAASKAAVIGFTKSLAKELMPLGITVHCIAPGLIDTDMIKNLPATMKKRFCENIPVNRFGEAAEIAKGALYLLTTKTSGKIVVMDGGWLA